MTSQTAYFQSILDAPLTIMNKHSWILFALILEAQLTWQFVTTLKNGWMRRPHLPLILMNTLIPMIVTPHARYQDLDVKLAQMKSISNAPEMAPGFVSTQHSGVMVIPSVIKQKMKI